ETNISGKVAKFIPSDNEVHTDSHYTQSRLTRSHTIFLATRLCCFHSVSSFPHFCSQSLLGPSLKLLVNLSFDTEAQAQMVAAGLIPKLVNLILDENNRLIALKILYHLSISDKAKPLFTMTDAIPLVRTCSRIRRR